MKKLIFPLVLAMVLTLSGAALAMDTASENFTIEATIVEPIGIEVEDIDFGTIYSFDNDHSEMVDFTVTGSEGEDYTINLDSNQVTLDSAETEDTLEVNLTLGAAEGTLVDGEDVVDLTATLQDPGAEVAGGDYQGEATVTVEYDY